LHCILLTFGGAEIFVNMAASEIFDHHRDFMEQSEGDQIYDLDSPLLAEGARAFWIAMHENTSNRVIFITDDNLLGVGPETLVEGDVIVYFYGAQVPFVLRPQDGLWRLVGECYMYGLVQCQDITSWSKSGGRTETFRLF
jgi:hypothetical protein